MTGRMRAAIVAIDRLAVALAVRDAAVEELVVSETDSAEMAVVVDGSTVEASVVEEHPVTVATSATASRAVGRYKAVFFMEPHPSDQGFRVAAILSMPQSLARLPESALKRI